MESVSLCMTDQPLGIITYFELNRQVKIIIFKIKDMITDLCHVNVLLCVITED